MGRITQGVKNTVKPFINVSAWMSFDFIKSSGRNIKNMLSGTFTPQKTDVVETFDQTLARQNLSTQDIERRKKEFRLLALVLFIMTIIAICYFIYLILSGHWKGSMVCFGVVLLISSLTFRYHFWAFQLQKRKLGCSFREWLNEGLLGKK